MFTRICPQCNKEVVHKSKKTQMAAIRNNKICMSCAASGKNNGMFGKKHTTTTIKKIKIKIEQQVITDETREKMSISARNRLKVYNHWLGRKHSDDARRKMTLHHSKKLIDNKWTPTYNIAACKVIDEYGKRFGYNFKHALNGGEYFIESLGYWVDGYDIDKNVVIEYYERNHLYTKEKDELRINKIKETLGCEVIILKEWVENDFKLINELLTDGYNE
jgi:hypothetical protein